MDISGSEQTPSRQRHARLLSVVIALLCVAAVFLGSGFLRQKQGPSFGGYAGADVQALCLAYEQSGDVHDLIIYLKALCYQAGTEQNKAAEPEIVRYGTELLNLAREETIDLEELGKTDDTLLELLRTIRSYGAK